MNASGTAAASSHENRSGMRASSLSRVTTNSALPPPPTMPKTRSPTFHRLDPEPISATSPAISIPRMFAGAPGGAGYLPCRCMMSARLSAEACTRTSSSPSRGSGRGTSRISNTSGLPARVTTAARMCVDRSRTQAKPHPNSTKETNPTTNNQRLLYAKRGA